MLPASFPNLDCAATVVAKAKGLPQACITLLPFPAGTLRLLSSEDLPVGNGADDWTWARGLFNQILLLHMPYVSCFDLCQRKPGFHLLRSWLKYGFYESLFNYCYVTRKSTGNNQTRKSTTICRGIGGTMKIRISRRSAAIMISAVFGGLAVAAFMLLGPPKLLAKSESPDFCASCHVMEDEHTAWRHSGAHRRIKCVDCHLPNGNPAVHYMWKSIDGMKDVVSFNSGLVPETINLSAHGEKVVQTNCIRCHEATVSRMDQTRKCWGCHRQLRHRITGTVASRE